jgi:hypothetical protein
MSQQQSSDVCPKASHTKCMPFILVLILIKNFLAWSLLISLSLELGFYSFKKKNMKEIF